MENLIRVSAVRWLDIETREADVHFEAGGNLYHAYSHPCVFEPGRSYTAVLDCLEQELSLDAMLTGNAEHAAMLVPRKDGFWAYDGYGHICAIRPLVVACGDLRVELGTFFRDERLIGEPIYFAVRRLNIYLSGPER